MVRGSGGARPGPPFVDSFRGLTALGAAGGDSGAFVFRMIEPWRTCGGRRRDGTLSLRFILSSYWPAQGGHLRGIPSPLDDCRPVQFRAAPADAAAGPVDGHFGRPLDLAEAEVQRQVVLGAAAG